MKYSFYQNCRWGEYQTEAEALYIYIFMKRKVVTNSQLHGENIKRILRLHHAMGWQLTRGSKG